MLSNLPVDFLAIPFRKYVQGLLEIVDVFKASKDFPSTPRIASNVDRWCERRYASNVMSLISKLAPDRPLPRVSKSNELQLGNLEQVPRSSDDFSYPTYCCQDSLCHMSTTIGLCEHPLTISN